MCALEPSYENIIKQELGIADLKRVIAEKDLEWNLETTPGVDNLASAIHRALRQVEREVLEQVIERIETVMEPQNESTDDQVWELRDWCKQQQEGL